MIAKILEELKANRYEYTNDKIIGDFIRYPSKQLLDFLIMYNNGDNDNITDVPKFIISSTDCPHINNNMSIIIDLLIAEFDVNILANIVVTNYNRWCKINMLSVIKHLLKYGIGHDTLVSTINHKEGIEYINGLFDQI